MFLLKLRSELQNLFKKFAVQYENINKLQTAFPRNGIFPRSGMNKGGGILGDINRRVDRGHRKNR